MRATPSMKNGTVLEARNLTLRFGGLEALNGLSFSIRSRQIVSVIGPNGAGKTTLLNAITGVYRTDTGEILFNGRSLSGLRPHQISALGISRTFQQTQLFEPHGPRKCMVGTHPRTTAGFLGGVLHLRGERKEEKRIREKAEEILDFLGLLPGPDGWRPRSRRRTKTA